MGVCACVRACLRTCMLVCACVCMGERACRPIYSVIRMYTVLYVRGRMCVYLKYGGREGRERERDNSAKELLMREWDENWKLKTNSPRTALNGKKSRNGNSDLFRTTICLAQTFSQNWLHLEIKIKLCYLQPLSLLLFIPIVKQVSP